MIKIIRLSGLACAVLCTHGAYADTPTPDAHRVEVLATMLTAYVSCDSKSELQRDVKDEIQTYDATPEEAKSALLTLSDDMMACAPLRKYAATLAEMADTDADEFADMLGIAQSTNNTDITAADRAAKPRQSHTAALTMRDVPLPPSNTNRHIGSDY